MDKTPIDIAWVVTCAAIVFLMQAGFMCLESGLTRSKNNINVATKNITDFGVSVLLFWGFGFAIMFGATQNGVMGSTYFFASVSDEGTWFAAFFLFQAMFVGTATTIVSGAVAERMRFGGYVLFAAILSGVIYPLFGHWAWAGTLSGEYVGWLGQLGFRDFAGSSVVHGTGAWVALAVVLVIGPRTGRFPPGEPPQRIPGSNLPLAILGTLLLWFGWFGFNGGSALAMDDRVPGIIVNTILAGVTGLVTAMGIGFRLYGKAEVKLPVNGALAGLVAITASCHAVSAPEAVLIGAVGATVMLAGESLLERLRIDDVVGAVPVHGMAGAWGTIALAVFGDPERIGTGLSITSQLAVQLLGIVVCFVWSFGAAYLVLKLIAPHLQLRVSPEDEHIGLNVAEHGASTDLLDLFTAMDVQARTGDLSIRAPVEPFTEVGQIASRYNGVLDRLEQARVESEAVVRSTTDAIIDFSQQVDGNALTVSEGVQKLRSSIEEIADSAMKVAGVAHEAVEAANSTNETVRRLGQSSAEIGEITKVITSIAKQTNLLALNATIESARAGEAGRGFAVVANAVKELSRKTAEATQGISEKIEAIQAESKRAVDAIARVSSIILEIDKYQGLVEKQSTATTQISRDVADAASGSVQTARNITVAARTARESASIVESTAKSGQALNELLEKLFAKIQVDR